MKVELFENKELVSYNGETYATRKQIENLYETNESTLRGSIKRLKSDGLVNTAKIRGVAEDGKNRELEVYDFDSILAIGMRLRSDRAIRLQRYMIKLFKKEMFELEMKRKSQQAQLDYFWDKMDKEDLY